MMPGVGVWRGVLRLSVARSSALRSVAAVRRQSLHTSPSCRATAGPEGSGSALFDQSVLQFLVCPLSRKPLRYDESRNELVNDELAIAYPIVDGIPNMTPQDARMIRKEQKTQESDSTQQ